MSTSDYEERLRSDSDNHFSTPELHTALDGTQFVFFKRRIWKGSPRERIYKSKYYRIDDDNAMQCMSLTLYAITVDEITTMLKASGFSPLKWLGHEETGFHKTICIAEKQDAN